MGFDELVEMYVENRSALAGDYSSGDHRSSSGACIASDIESRTSSILGGSEKVFENGVRLH